MIDQQVTVFGGSGFLGREIVRHLHAAGCRVRAVARRARAGASEAGIETLSGDIRDTASVAAAVKDADLVVNAVGLYVEGGRETFAATHVNGAAELADAARRSGARLVHVSGIGVDSQSPSPYIRARAEGEARVRESLPDAVILRPSALFGPNDALLSTLDTMTRYLPVVPLFGAGTNRLQPVFVGDVAAAVQRVAEDGASPGTVYELGGPVQYRYRDLIGEILAFRRRRRVLLPVPFALWTLQSACLSLLPNPPLTRDQVILMRSDNVVDPAAPGFADLGIAPRALADLLPDCLP